MKLSLLLLMFRRKHEESVIIALQCLASLIFIQDFLVQISTYTVYTYRVIVIAFSPPREMHG
jgi:hypothetical protein